MVPPPLTFAFVRPRVGGRAKHEYYLHLLRERERERETRRQEGKGKKGESTTHSSQQQHQAVPGWPRFAFLAAFSPPPLFPRERERGKGWSLTEEEEGPDVWNVPRINWYSERGQRKMEDTAKIPDHTLAHTQNWNTVKGRGFHSREKIRPSTAELNAFGRFLDPLFPPSLHCLDILGTEAMATVTRSLIPCIGERRA